jgi:arginase family enzyme
MPEEKRKYLEKLNQEFDSFAAMPPVISDFLKRMTREKVNVVSTQNLSWMGFFRAPFSHDFAEADVVIAGAGTDYGTLSETGDMRHAPQYLRHESRKFIPVHAEWEMAPFEQVSVIDMGDIDVFALSYEQQLDHLTSWLKRVAEHDCFCLLFGGEHSVGHAGYEAVRVLIDRHFDGTPVGGIIFDGHCDLLVEGGMGGLSEDTRDNANFLSAAMARGTLDPDRFVCMGIREQAGGALSGWGLARELGIPVVSPRMVAEKGAPYWRDFVAERVGDGPCVIECDLDGLDPVMSGGGVSTRDGFGLSWREYQTIARAFHGKDLIWANIVEYVPARDPSGTVAANVSHLGFEILCMLSAAKVRLNGGEHRQTHWKNNLSTSIGNNLSTSIGYIAPAE